MEGDLKKVLKPTFTVESHHPYVYEVQQSVTITCKGADTFYINPSMQTKFPPMDFLRAIRVINPATGEEIYRLTNDSSTAPQTLVAKDQIEFIFDYIDIKKQKLEYLVGHPVPECYGYFFSIVPNFNKDLLDLKEYLDQILRSCSWLIGRFSYSLIRIKKAEKETDEEKNYKLLLHSKIFSGGFENRYLHLFSKRTVKKMQELADITEDKDFLEYFTNDLEALSVAADKVLMAILYDRRNDKVDRLIELLQKNFSKTVIWSNIGGLIGERMVRSAFAPMIKFSSLSQDFQSLLEDL